MPEITRFDEYTIPFFDLHRGTGYTKAFYNLPRKDRDFFRGIVEIMLDDSGSAAYLKRLKTLYDSRQVARKK